MFEFRDKNEKGKMIVFAKVNNPAFIADKCGVRFKFGEYKELYKLLPIYSVLGDIILVEAPKDQKEIDVLFQSSGYFKKWIQRIK